MLQKAYKIYCRVQEIIVGSFFAAIVFLTFINAVLRTMNRPIPTTDDICSLLFAWSALLGADVALRYSRLVGMDILVTKLPPKLQKFFQLVVFTIMITAMVLFIRYGVLLATRNWPRFLNTLPISYGWVTLSFPVACCMMILTTIIKAAKTIIHFKDDSYNVKKDIPDIVGEEYTTGVDPNELGNEAKAEKLC
jgi:TRAP-type C4-dicarboxylate transport system permease small subunit